MRLDSFNARLRDFIESSAVQNTVIAVILLNSLTLGLETSPWFREHYGLALFLIDRAAITFFVVEVLIKLFVYRLGFFRSAWNVFDFLVVAVTLIPTTGNISVLRMLRIVRAFRLISAVKSMRTVVEGLLRALPGMGSIAMLLCLVFYVGAVMATTMFGAVFEDWFGSVGRSAFSLFQIMTLESWSMGIARPVMEVYPHAWIFFVTFILLSSFTVLNLFIAIIVNAVNYVSVHTEHAPSSIELLTQEIAKLRREVQALTQGDSLPGKGSW